MAVWLVIPDASSAAGTVKARILKVLAPEVAVVRSQQHAAMRVRVLGIAAPEHGQCGGCAAIRGARQALAGRRVLLKRDARQPRRREDLRLYYVRLPNGRDYGLTTIRSGTAQAQRVVARRPKMDQVYRRAQARALMRRRGMSGSSGVRRHPGAKLPAMLNSPAPATAADVDRVAAELAVASTNRCASLRFWQRCTGRGLQSGAPTDK
jgi:endonuclease YncB( thermonuclease family)